MAMNPSFAELLKKNEIVSSKHQVPLKFAEMRAQGIAPTKTLVLSCADPRADPAYFLDLSPGEVIVFRNTGGQIRPLLNDFLAIDFVLGLERVMIVHHTDCGTHLFTSDQVREELRRRDPTATGLEEQHFCGVATSYLEQSIKNDVELLKQSKFVRQELKDNVKGFLYDIDTGKLKLIAE